jgi:predicted transcriptional regulator
MPAKESAEVRAALKLLDNGKAKTISEAARMAGVNRSTIQRAKQRRAQKSNNNQTGE